MSLRVEFSFPGGSVAGVRIDPRGDRPEITFAADPAGGPESLWFYFRLVEKEAGSAHADKVDLTLRFVRNMLGCGSPLDLRPVLRAGDQNWSRSKAGTVRVAPDGQRSVTWSLPYPDPSIDVALCFPYGRRELNTLVQKSKGYWSVDELGLSQGARPIVRLSNEYGSASGRHPGLYIVARQHAGETPGSWVLDGMLEYFSRTKNNRLVVWAVPFVDVDGVECGFYGKDRFPYDMNRAWTTPPMRHETLAIQRDIEEWRTRCQPLLMLDLHAPGGTESDGIYAYLPCDPEGDAPSREVEKWANVIADGLGPAHAAGDFKRVVRDPARWETATFSRYAHDSLGIGALILETPYAMCRETVMTQKQYREAGRSIARAILQRAH